MTSPQCSKLAKVIFQISDLEQQEQALLDFGLLTSLRTERKLLMRGYGEEHHIHETRLGDENRFIGIAIEVSSEEELERLAKLPGSGPVEENDDPDGGLIVRMKTPDGFEVNAVYGRQTVEALSTRGKNPFNSGDEKERIGSSIRVTCEPSPVLRLGHVVFRASNHDETVHWFNDRFDLLPSDYLTPAPLDGVVVGTFLRFDCGDVLVDHHSFLILQSDTPGLHHHSYEVQDIDALAAAHDYLESKGWQLDCGIGRHLLGSQVFDYWIDPFGFRIEHYTDGDVVDAEHEPTCFDGSAAETTQWGMEPPAHFFT